MKYPSRHCAELSEILSPVDPLSCATRAQVAQAATPKVGKGGLPISPWPGGPPEVHRPLKDISVRTLHPDAVSGGREEGIDGTLPTLPIIFGILKVSANLLGPATEHLAQKQLKRRSIGSQPEGAHPGTCRNQHQGLICPAQKNNELLLLQNNNCLASTKKGPRVRCPSLPSPPPAAPEAGLESAPLLRRNGVFFGVENLKFLVLFVLSCGSGWAGRPA